MVLREITSGLTNVPALVVPWYEKLNSAVRCDERGRLSQRMATDQVPPRAAKFGVFTADRSSAFARPMWQAPQSNGRRKSGGTL